MRTILKNSIFLSVCLLVLAGCFSAGKKKLNPRPSLWYKDKIPYGTWFAFNSLAKMHGDSNLLVRDYNPEFYGYDAPWSADSLVAAYQDSISDRPGDSISSGVDIESEIQEADTVSEIPATDSDSEITVTDSVSEFAESLTKGKDYDLKNDVDPNNQLYLIIGYQFYPSDNEIDHLLNYATYGNHLLVSSLSMNTPFLKKMGLSLESEFFDSSNGDTVLYRLRPDTLHKFRDYGYPGFNVKQYFTISDSTKTWTVLGTTESGKPNCIRLQYGLGTVTLQCNPYLLSNFFLLHKENQQIWTSMLEGLSGPFSIIWWDTYFRKRDASQKGFSALGVLLQYPSLKWAFYTALILLGALLLSEVKRRQKAIPVIPPPENPSLDFVKTIGRLYYNSHDNVDLVYKIESQFWDFVRQHYNLTVNQPPSALSRTLALKAGVEENLVKSILHEFKAVEEHGAVSDEDLIHINQLIEQFHKNRT